MKLAMRFEGGSDLAAALAQLRPRVSRKVQLDALREGAEPMRQRMAELAPHEPGKPDLKDTMTVSTARGEDIREVAVAVGPSKVGFYGSFQEFGTVHHSAQPFARPAFDAVSPESLRIISAALWRELAGRKIGRNVTSATAVIGGPSGGLV